MSVAQRSARQWSIIHVLSISILLTLLWLLPGVAPRQTVTAALGTEGLHTGGQNYHPAAAPTATAWPQPTATPTPAADVPTARAPLVAPGNTPLLDAATRDSGSEVPTYNLPWHYSQINDEGRSATWPNIAAGEDGSLYAILKDDSGGDNHNRIYLSDSSDGGVTWSSNHPVSDEGIEDYYPPAIAVGPEGAVYVTWLDNWEGQPVEGHDVYLSRSLDGGQTWSPFHVATAGYIKWGFEVSDLSIGVDQGGIIYVTWVVHSKRASEAVYVSTSNDQGVTWSSPVDVGWMVSEGGAIYSALAVGDAVAYVISGDQDPPTNLMKTEDGGQTWTAVPNDFDAITSVIAVAQGDQDLYLGIYSSDELAITHKFLCEGGAT